MEKPGPGAFVVVDNTETGDLSTKTWHSKFQNCRHHASARNLYTSTRPRTAELKGALKRGRGGGRVEWHGLIDMEPGLWCA